jgi:YVTN family beta-propeller protein
LVTNREDLDKAKGSPDIPADIRAFLIADIRGYTLFTQERGDEAAAKLAAKFAHVTREGVEARAGEVIELRGDEALCIFASPRQAIRAAVELQDRFVAETLSDPALPLAVGIGLDAGEAVPVEGGYRGGALNLAARLCGQAGPGEIVASREIAHLARRVDGVRYADRREVSLKGMTDPVTMIEVSSEAGPAAARLAPLIPRPKPPSRPTVSPPRRTRRRLLVVTLALVVVAVAIPIVLSGGGDGLTSVAPNSVGVIDPESGNILRSIELPNAPGSMAAGAGAVWVTAPDVGRIMRIDAQTETVVDSSIQVGSAPAGIAVGEGAVWVVDSDGPSLVRVSPETNEKVATVPVGNGPAGVAVTAGAVWVTNRLDGTVSRIDPATNEVSETIPVGQAPTGIAADGDGVWVANSDDGTVVRIDPGTNTVDMLVHVGNQPGAVAVGPDGIWVANTLDGTVSRIDPGTGVVTRVISVGLGPSAIAFAGGSVWVMNEFDGTVSQVDIDTDSEAHSIATVSAPRGAATVGGAPWVSVRGAVTNHRGGTLRVVASDLGDSIDPAFLWADWIQINTNDGLVGFKRVGGQDGLTLVPNMAVSLPTVSDAGKTYRFKLREGIRYSTGVPARASDFRLAFERGFRIEDSYLRQYGALTIVGAAECMKTPETCDLTGGIETDDAAGAITFHLTEPDPSLIYKLALPFTAAVPAGTPMTDTGTSPVPATGPYMVDEYVKGERLVLVRNPEFNEWYAPAQPDGYPDRIEVTLGLSADEQVTEVEQGRADWAVDSNDFTQEMVENLVTQYAGQVHPYPELTTIWLALNTSIPPFNDPRARRAVNYALDRSEVADLYGGSQRATVTCQFLPPNLPGFERYCPYTREPNPAGQWSGPDLDRAEALIDASGTTGDTVLYAPLPQSPFPELERYSVRLLEELGYRVQLVRSKNEGQYTAAVYRSPDQVHASMSGWISDYPTASDFFFGAPRCGSAFNPYAATFCDPELEAAIRRAERAQSTSPQRAGGLWANADRMIVDLSPWVFLINPIRLDFVSARVGNYQHSPQWGILLDQLWVR